MLATECITLKTGIKLMLLHEHAMMRTLTREGQLLVHNTEPNVTKKISTMRTYRACNRESLNAYKRDKYALSEPKPATKDAYVKDLEKNLLGNKEAKA